MAPPGEIITGNRDRGKGDGRSAFDSTQNS